MAPNKQSISTKESSTSENATAPTVSARQATTNLQPSPTITGNSTKPLAGGSQPKVNQNASSSMKKDPTPKTSGNGMNSESTLTVHSVPATTKDRPLTEVISEKFTPFDHNRLVVGPFTEETARDASFEQELGALLLDAMLETHAWAAARPKFESQLAVQKLENKISEVIEVENRQEQTRQNLNEFVTHMKTALERFVAMC
ncbi:hypothetical protein LENED_008798 [Lentinula edodes]|uniref:Uncharacterized protein n=1 Tax=Lentinula edodes TaxID=5353 RepID=A0A1Q3EI31_LENED|nr:hypothetical protein LENED_008798 [Lentinula edodes]